MVWKWSVVPSFTFTGSAHTTSLANTSSTESDADAVPESATITVPTKSVSIHLFGFYKAMKLVSWLYHNSTV